MRQHVCKVYCIRYQSPFYLWWIKPARKQNKLTKYYGQNCRCDSFQIRLHDFVGCRYHWNESINLKTFGRKRLSRENTIWKYIFLLDTASCASHPIWMQNFFIYIISGRNCRFLFTYIYWATLACKPTTFEWERPGVPLIKSYWNHISGRNQLIPEILSMGIVINESSI